LLHERRLCHSSLLVTARAIKNLDPLLGRDGEDEEEDEEEEEEQEPRAR